MSNYGDTLRNERRLELAQRALPAEMLNEYGEITFATKKEGSSSFPASDYAYVPDPDKPSTWKLRLTSTPGGDPDPRIVGAALAALGKGYRGNKVSIPSEDMAKVKAKVKSAWLKANPDKTSKDLPSVVASAEDLVSAESENEETEFVEETIVACGDDQDFSINVTKGTTSASPAPEIWDGVQTLKDLAKASFSGYDVKIHINIDTDNPEEAETELYISTDGISQTPSDVISMAFDSFVSKVKEAYGDGVGTEVKIKAKYRDEDSSYKDQAITEDVSRPMPAYYDTEGVEEFAELPPALKAQLVKKLTAQAKVEKDPKKKAAIEAKIEAYSNSLDDVEEFAELPPALKAQLVKKLIAQAKVEKDPKKKAALEAKIEAYSK